MTRRCFQIGFLAVILCGTGLWANTPGHAAAPPAAIQSQIAQALQQNHTGQAEAMLARALASYPSWKEGWWELGSLAYERNDYLRGRSAFGHLTELDPKAGAPWIMLGLCDFELRDFGLSLFHIEQGRALGFPKNPGISSAARYHQALDLILLQEYEQASFLLDSFARANEHSSEVVLAEGLAALQIPALAPTYRSLVDEPRYHVVSQAGEAQYLAAAHKLEEARKLYEQLVAQNPRMPGLHYAFGALLVHWGELNAAVKQFDAELQLNPHHVPSLLQIAASDLKLGQPAAGLPYAQRAVRQAPESFAAHFVTGQILVAEGKLQDGAAELETSRDLEPNSSQVRYALAQAYLKLHRRADAMREEAAFHRLKPIEDSMLQKGTLPASVFEPGEGKPAAGAAARH